MQTGPSSPKLRRAPSFAPRPRLIKSAVCSYWCAIRSSNGAKDGGMDEIRTRDLLRDRQTL